MTKTTTTNLIIVLLFFTLSGHSYSLCAMRTRPQTQQLSLQQQPQEHYYQPIANAPEILKTLTDTTNTPRTAPYPVNNLPKEKISFYRIQHASIRKASKTTFDLFNDDQEESFYPTNTLTYSAYTKTPPPITTKQQRTFYRSQIKTTTDFPITVTNTTYTPITVLYPIRTFNNEEGSTYLTKNMPFSFLAKYCTFLLHNTMKSIKIYIPHPIRIIIERFDENSISIINEDQQLLLCTVPVPDEEIVSL